VVRIRRLRILVEILRVGMRRRRVEVVVILLHVFAVIPLRIGQPKEPLFDDGVFAVPQRNGETQELAIVAESRDAVFPTAVAATPSLVVREVAPRVARTAVILATRPPLPLAEVRAPRPPRDFLLTRFLQSHLLGVHGALLARLGAVNSP